MNKTVTVVITYLVLITSFSCKHFYSQRKYESTKPLKIGKIAILLPNCYSLYFPDSLEPNHEYLVKGDSIKLDIITDGLQTLELNEEARNNKSTTCLSDTINEHYLRQICRQQEDAPWLGYLWIDIVDADTSSETLFTELDRKAGRSRRYNVILIANTPDGISLGKEERNLLMEAFKEAVLLKQ